MNDESLQGKLIMLCFGVKLSQRKSQNRTFYIVWLKSQKQDKQKLLLDIKFNKMIKSSVNALKR